MQGGHYSWFILLDTYTIYIYIYICIHIYTYSYMYIIPKSASLSSSLAQDKRKCKEGITVDSYCLTISTICAVGSGIDDKHLIIMMLSWINYNEDKHLIIMMLNWINNNDILLDHFHYMSSRVWYRWQAPDDNNYVKLNKLQWGQASDNNDVELNK
jgi:hypothetical protein